MVALVRTDGVCHIWRSQVFLNPYYSRETFLHFALRVGDGVRCPSSTPGAFDLGRSAGHLAGFLAEQFYGLAIEVHDESLTGQLAGGGAISSLFKQCARRFIPVNEYKRLLPTRTDQ